MDQFFFLVPQNVVFVGVQILLGISPLLICNRRTLKYILVFAYASSRLIDIDLYRFISLGCRFPTWPFFDLVIFPSLLSFYFENSSGGLFHL